MKLYGQCKKIKWNMVNLICDHWLYYKTVYSPVEIIQNLDINVKETDNYVVLLYFINDR